MKQLWCICWACSPAMISFCDATVAPRAAFAQEAGREFGEFDSRLDALVRANPATKGRDNIIAGCEALLSEFPDHPLRAKAMLRLAQLHGLSNPDNDPEQMREESLAWCRRAAESADVGSNDWCEAHFGIARLLRRPSSSRRELTEARLSLENVLQETKSPFLKLRAEFELIHQNRLENNPLGVELHAQHILDWDENSAEAHRISDRDRTAIRALQAAASHELITLAADAANMDSMPTASVAGTKEERIEYVKKVAERTPHPGIRESAARAIARITDSPIPPAMMVDMPLVTETSTGRRYFIALNIAVIIALGTAVVAKKYRQRRSSM